MICYIVIVKALRGNMRLLNVYFDVCSDYTGWKDVLRGLQISRTKSE